jgi:outer membrane cobalamin receptor
MEDSLLSTQVMYSGDRKGYSSDMSAYTIVNASYLKYLSNNTHLKFGVENLFNENYELAAGYNTDGTSLNVGLIYTGF